ncbi:MAG: SLC13 family permease [Gemmatimonadota bacterium]|nr:SLC13 family permease [Gemmatimonadota bacterium]
MERKKPSGTKMQRIGLIAGPVLAIALLLFTDLEPGRPAVTRTAAVALLMAVWWMTEAVPLAATALLPVVLFPLLGIMGGKKVAPIYFNHVIFLFVGGFMVALAMQRWNLHRRIALRVLLWCGVRPRRILLGFMVSTAFLSMWISNTATTMMMVPIVLAVVLKLEEGAAQGKLATGLFLGVAYGASIGGVATLVGTPPNLSFARILNIHFPDAPEISFANWFLFAFPISVLFLVVAWILLSWLHAGGRQERTFDQRVLRDQYEALGPLSYEEAVVLADFVLLAFLWLFRNEIRVGDTVIPGWSGLFPGGVYLNDGSVAMGMALLLFLIPARGGSAEKILDRETVAKLPWHIILLFGGGFALATGFIESGLSLWFGHRLAGLSAVHPLLLVAVLCLMITFLTELTSNTATAEMFLPILAALGVAIQVNPLLLMIPATLSCSFAFMLPVATPPNAIVFGTDRVRMTDMVRVGLILNLTGVAIVAGAIYLLGGSALGIELTGVPEWAK